MLQVSPEAVAHLKALRETRGGEEKAVRVSRVAGRLRLSWVPEPRATDVVVKEGDLRVCVAKDVAGGVADPVIDVTRRVGKRRLVFRPQKVATATATARKGKPA